MGESDQSAMFFNRPHLIQGAQVLATVFCMFGVVFAGLDRLNIGFVKTSTLWWIFVGLGLSLLAGILSRRINSGTAPFLAGAALGLLYLAVTWLIARH
jgi:hypothetical protein